MVGKIRAYKNQRRIPGIKIQSAMEYLSTYGWAILIIAIVLGALYSLGVFSTNNQPRQVAGACQVLRPDGPGTLNHISLSGPCNAGIPQYVSQFNGQNSRILVGSNALNLNDVSVSAWFKSGRQYASDPNGDTYHAIVSKGIYATGGGGTSGSYTIGWGNGQDQQLSFGVGIGETAYLSPIDTNTLSGWNFVVGTYNGVAICLYVDTVFSGCTAESGQIQSTSDPFVIGSDAQGRFFNGSVSNVQVYNTALSQNGIKALYQEGISGAPINLRNLVGWWPLNGDTNDYSGNGNNGVPGNIIYVSQYSYTPP